MIIPYQISLFLNVTVMIHVLMDQIAREFHCISQYDTTV